MYLQRSFLRSFLGDSTFDIVASARIALPESLDLVREYAVATAREAWSDTRPYPDCSVAISFSIWARYILIDRAYYIADLTNTPVTGYGYMQIFDATKTPPIDVLYVSEDSLGIRQIVLKTRQVCLGWRV